ncbi:uncharacterized protein [Brachyistius frenatus]|uniref:uncharacterized protein isoform X2 n=1 Tax=Brachyistius frenatus TaxID=100188 RepID=UPI0037E7CDBA
MLIIFYSLLMLRVGFCTDDRVFDTKTVRVGDDVKLSCANTVRGSLFWIRPVSGNFPEVLGRSYSFRSVHHHIRAQVENRSFLLYISKANLSDTAVYYCVEVREQSFKFVKGTSLIVEGPEAALTTVPPRDLVPPEDSVTLRCSVLRDSQNKTCPADDSMFCFSAESHESHPDLNLTHVNDGYKNEKNPDGVSSKKCFYSYFKNFTSSDSRTYFCAVATCGNTLLGNKSKLNPKVNTCDLKTDRAVLYLLCAALAISLMVIAFLLYSIKKLTKKSYGLCKAEIDLQTNTAASGDQENQQMRTRWFILHQFSPIKKLVKEEQGTENLQRKRASTLMSRLLGWNNILTLDLLINVYLILSVHSMRNVFSFFF